MKSKHFSFNIRCSKYCGKFFISEIIFLVSQLLVQPFSCVVVINFRKSVDMK